MGSAIDFKKRFRIHESDINTKKDRCGVARNFNNKCRHPQNTSAFLKIQPIEQMCVEDESKLDETFWDREKFWQALLFTNSYGMNSLADLYSKKRKRYRKKWFCLFHYIIKRNSCNWKLLFACKILF